MKSWQPLNLEASRDFAAKLQDRAREYGRNAMGFATQKIHVLRDKNPTARKVWDQVQSLKEEYFPKP